MLGGLIGGIASSLVSNIAGGLVSNLLSSSLGGLLSQFGMSNLAGAFTNIFMESFGGALKEIIGNSPFPQFIKDAANNMIDNIVGSNKQQTTSECQAAAKDSDMGEIFSNLGRNIAQQGAEEADKKTKGGGAANWLVALAGALAEVQAKFLSDAMDNMDKMKANMADKNDSKKEAATKRDAFITAQSEYQANMQMFNMIANMTATSLKSLGEGLTAIARKQ
jgi:hypothetical protein